MPTLKQLAVETLTHMVEDGRQRLAVDDDARGILRQWMLHARQGGAPAPAPASAPDVSFGEDSGFMSMPSADDDLPF